ncbi:MAG: hypothetical protein ABSG51_10745 [Terracidiphilus sp.]
MAGAGQAQFEAGDSLLLCTDGLWGFVPEQAIANVMTNPEIEACAAAAELLNLALQAGGLDNIGIEVVYYGNPVAEQAPIAGLEEDKGEDKSEDEIDPRRGRKRAIMVALLQAVGVGASAVWYAEQEKWIPQISLSR